MYEHIDVMEKCSSVGLICMALVDLLFCATTLGDSFLVKDRLVYHHRNASYFFALYGNFLQNVFIKVSTWSLVLMAIARHMIVHHPLRARIFIKPFHAVLANVASLIIWIGLHSPILWTWKVKDISCPGNRKLVFLTAGYYLLNAKLRQAFMIVWFLLGFILPMGILLYCNVKLIRSLHTIHRLRAHITASTNRVHDYNRRITVTLIGIIVMLIICITPSELFSFYLEVASHSLEANYISAILVFCNALLTVNFSGNFVVYFTVNSYFRKAVRQMITCCAASEFTESASAAEELHINV